MRICVFLTQLRRNRSPEVLRYLNASSAFLDQQEYGRVERAALVLPKLLYPPFRPARLFRLPCRTVLSG